MQIVLASQNRGKLKEFQTLFQELPVELVSLADYTHESPEETATTFIENALIKARFAVEKTGLPALADDSGLCVNALKGAPGIYSARLAEMQNAQKNNAETLLDLMHDVPEGQRGAAFVCCLAFMRHSEDPTPIIAEARWPGEITFEPSGHGGFGYDPVVYLPDQACTVASLPEGLKNKLSHRAQAFHQFLERLNFA